jgi:hypothetical protein
VSKSVWDGLGVCSWECSTSVRGVVGGVFWCGGANFVFQVLALALRSVSSGCVVGGEFSRSYAILMHAMCSW